LFVFLQAIVASWFLCHLQRWFASALVGSLLLVVIPLAYATFTSFAGDELKALPAKVLGAPRARTILIILILVGMAALFLTSSIYFEYAPVGAETKDCTVEIIDVATNTPFASPITVTPKDTVGGRPFLFRFFPTKLRFQVAESPGREPKMDTLSPGKRILWRAPADFPAKQFHVVRIVFGPRLWNNLAEPTDATSVFYDLLLTMGAKTTTMDDIRRQTIYLGASSEGLDFVFKTEDPVERKNDFGERLTTLGCPAEQQQIFVDAWTSKRRTIATEEPRPGETITIALRRRGGAAPIAREETKKTNTAAIQTVALEIP